MTNPEVWWVTDTVEPDTVQATPTLAETGVDVSVWGPVALILVIAVASVIGIATRRK